MALSTDNSFLIAATFFGTDAHLGKLNSSDGMVLNSSYASTHSYAYIYASDERALCIDGTGKFQLLNTTSFNLLTSGELQ